jgi:antitoxin ParD1/3/4
MLTGGRKCRQQIIASWLRAVTRIQLGREVAVGMIGSMTRQKIAITLPEEQVAAARQAVAEGRAASVSAFISQALARRDADEELAETIAEIYAESGQPTAEDRRWARRVLGLEP